jgi:hypothetical protein
VAGIAMEPSACISDEQKTDVTTSEPTETEICQMNKTCIPLIPPVGINDTDTLLKLLHHIPICIRRRHCHEHPNSAAPIRRASLKKEDPRGVLCSDNKSTALLHQLLASRSKARTQLGGASREMLRLLF